MGTLRNIAASGVTTFDLVFSDELPIKKYSRGPSPAQDFLVRFFKERNKNRQHERFYREYLQFMVKRLNKTNYDVFKETWDNTKLDGKWGGEVYMPVTILSSRGDLDFDVETISVDGIDDLFQVSFYRPKRNDEIFEDIFGEFEHPREEDGKIPKNIEHCVKVWELNNLTIETVFGEDWND